MSEMFKNCSYAIPTGIFLLIDLMSKILGIVLYLSSVLLVMTLNGKKKKSVVFMISMLVIFETVWILLPVSGSLSEMMKEINILKD